MVERAWTRGMELGDRWTMGAPDLSTAVDIHRQNPQCGPEVPLLSLWEQDPVPKQRNEA